MQVYKIAIKGNAPYGAMFQTRREAEREIKFLKQDDARHADRAMSEAGVKVEMPEYEIVELELN